MRGLWFRYEKCAYLGVAAAAIVLPWAISIGIYLVLRR